MSLITNFSNFFEYPGITIVNLKGFRFKCGDDLSKRLPSGGRGQSEKPPAFRPGMRAKPSLVLVDPKIFALAKAK